METNVWEGMQIVLKSENDGFRIAYPTHSPGKVGASGAPEGSAYNSKNNDRV